MDFSIRVWQKNDEYVASCPELDVHCFGPDKDRATSRLKSVIQFYFDSAQDYGDLSPNDESEKSSGNETGEDTLYSHKEGGFH